MSFVICKCDNGKDSCTFVTRMETYMQSRNCHKTGIIDAGHWIKGTKPKVSGSVMRRFVGMTACFIVSGLMHELVYW